MSTPITISLPDAPVARLHSGGSSPDDSDVMWPTDSCGPWRTPTDDDELPGCGGDIEEDQPVRKLNGWWMHADCARKTITSADVDAAWLLLADQVADRPHKFRSSEIRTVLRAVTAIAARGVK